MLCYRAPVDDRHDMMTAGSFFFSLDEAVLFLLSSVVTQGKVEHLHCISVF